MTTRFGLKSSRGLRAASAGLALASLLAWGTSARAAFIVNDTWGDSNRTEQENGTDSDADGDIESQWFINSPNVAITPGHLTSTQPTGSQNWTTYFAADATPVTLANAGDTLTVKLKFTPQGVSSGNTSQTFPFCVVDTPGAARVSTDAAPGTAAYAGYAMYTNFSNPLGNSNPFQLKERSAANSTLLNAGGDWTALVNGANSGNSGYVSGTQYTMTWIMTRTAGPDTIGGNGDDGLTIDVTMAGGSLNNGTPPHVNFTDTTPNTFSYDTFNVRPSAAATTATSFDLNQFQVDFTRGAVPEPASLVLIGLGGVGMLLLGRRRK